MFFLIFAYIKCEKTIYISMLVGIYVLKQKIFPCYYQAMIFMSHFKKLDKKDYFLKNSY